MKVLSQLGMAIALASAGSMIVAPQSAMAQKEKKKKSKKGKQDESAQAGPQLDLSPAYLEVYQLNNNLLTAGDTAQVQANLPAVQALISTPSDDYIHGNLTFNLGQRLRDNDLQVAGIERMLKFEQYLPVENKPIFLFILGNVAFDKKDNQKAITKLMEAYNAGYRSNNIELLLGYAYNRENNAVEAVRWFENGMEASKTNGSTVDKKSLLGNMAVAAIQSGDQALIDSTFKKVLPQTDDSALWHDGLSQLVRNSNFSEQENLDILRLMREKESLLFVSEYAEYAQAADARRLPNEVLNVINAGIEKGHIPSSDITFKDHINAAESRLASDKADLPAAERDARSSANGRSARATADALFSYGEYQRAVDLYKLAIEKGDVDVDRALNRMGIAQIKLGDYDAAISSFAAMTTPNRKNIGEYWTIYAKSLQNPAPVEPAATPAS